MTHRRHTAAVTVSGAGHEVPIAVGETVYILLHPPLAFKTGFSICMGRGCQQK